MSCRFFLIDMSCRLILVVVWYELSLCYQVETFSDKSMTSPFFGIVCFTIFSLSYAVRPLVFIHGLTDTYESFDTFQSYLEADFPGIEVFSLDAFNKDDSVEPIRDQIKVFSEMVRNITDEYGDITLVGHSQGAFISRAILQTTGNPHIHTLISLAAPGNFLDFASFFFHCTKFGIRKGYPNRQQDVSSESRKSRQK